MTRPQDMDSGAAIRLGERTLDPNATRWGMLLVLFMRVVAGLWILQGLVQWQIVLTAPTDLFSTIPKPTAVAIVYFAVMDLLAAVGLWLATAWGGVLWLLVALSQILVAFLMPDFFGGSRIGSFQNPNRIASLTFGSFASDQYSNRLASPDAPGKPPASAIKAIRPSCRA